MERENDRRQCTNVRLHLFCLLWDANAILLFCVCCRKNMWKCPSTHFKLPLFVCVCVTTTGVARTDLANNSCCFLHGIGVIVVCCWFSVIHILALEFLFSCILFFDCHVYLLYPLRHLGSLASLLINSGETNNRKYISSGMWSTTYSYEFLKDNGFGATAKNKKRTRANDAANEMKNLNINNRKRCKWIE